MHRAKSTAALHTMGDDAAEHGLSRQVILPAMPLAQEVLGSRRHTSFSASACANISGILNASTAHPPLLRRHSSKLLKLKGFFEKMGIRLPSKMGSDSAPVSPAATSSSPRCARGHPAQQPDSNIPRTPHTPPSNADLLGDMHDLFSSSAFGSDASPMKSHQHFEKDSFDDGLNVTTSSSGGSTFLNRTLHSPGPTTPLQRKFSNLAAQSLTTRDSSLDGRVPALTTPLSSPTAFLFAAGTCSAPPVFSNGAAASPVTKSTNSRGERPLPPMPQQPSCRSRHPPPTVAAGGSSPPLQQLASPIGSPRPCPPVTLAAAVSAAAATLTVMSVQTSGSARRAQRAYSSNLETADTEPVALLRGTCGAGAGSLCIGGSGNSLAAALTLANPQAVTATDSEEASRRRLHSTDDPAPMTGASASLLLAVSPALPSAMSRPVWSLEDYTISRRLYKGSSSSVYKATCSRSGLPVALKVYFLNRLPGNCFHMLKREIEVHVQLAHTHIARLYGAFVERGVPGSSTPSTKVVLVQEYAARGDLFDLHERLGGRMKPAHVATLILKPLLEALSHMHSHGILHRDIKPANVLFTTDWRLLVADFGVSINLHHERAVTRAGTEGYMAPEVERCPLKADPQENKDKPQLAYSTAVDIWAVGCMAYELMVGFLPPIAPAAQHAPTESGLAALEFPPTVLQEARMFILSAIAADPGARPTAAQLLASEWLQGDGVA